MGIIQSYLSNRVFVGDLYPVHLMGIINLSPESFFKESFIPKDAILPQIMDDLANGATFLDFGARSTAPWSDPITINEEYARVEQALKIALPHIPKSVVLSIDTQYSEIVELAIKLAAPYDIPLLINDISSFHTDPKIKDMVVSHNLPVCLMATQEKPGDAKSISEILHALFSTIESLSSDNYDLSQVIIDPGVGKWIAEKTFEYDLEMLHSLEDFRALQAPILVGLSRKSFIGSVLEKKNPIERLDGSLAATSVAVFNGAHIIRAHQITKKLRETVQMASAIRKNVIQTQIKDQKAVLLPNFHTKEAAEIFLRRSGVSKGGAAIMRQKMIHRLIQIDNLTAPQALILKQEMLARNGEVAIHKDVITTENQKYEKKFTVVLMGTQLEFQKLISKLKNQDLELNQIGMMIERLIQQAETPKTNFSKILKIIKNKTNP
ncbi:dihydropteroate synthase [Candidatus Harpocratesius sp.]